MKTITHTNKLEHKEYSRIQTNGGKLRTKETEGYKLKVHAGETKNNRDSDVQSFQ